MVVLDGEEYLTVEEAAALLGVKRETLYAYVSRGILKSYKQGMKRQRLYRRAEVEALWERGATDITVGGVHCLMSGPAWSRLEGLAAQAADRGVRFGVVGTNGVIHRDAPAWYQSVPIEELLADVIRSVNTRGSVRAVEGR